MSTPNKKKADNAQFSFKIPIYRRPVHVYAVPDRSVANSILDSLGYHPQTEQDEACTAMKHGHHYIIFQAGHISHPIISHEIDHLVDDLWEFIGVELNYKANECKAYLVQWLHETIANGLSRRLIEISAT